MLAPSFNYKQGSLDIVQFAHSFYFMEGIRALLPERPECMAKERAQTILEAWDIQLKEVFAPIFYAYICQICFAENRHAKRITFAHEDLIIGGDGSRSAYYHKEQQIDADTILKITQQLFQTKHNFSGGYGGAKWAAIAKAGLLYHTLPPAVFIDHVFDLKHNGGIALNKPTNHFILIGPLLKGLLDYKVNYNLASAGCQQTYFASNIAHEHNSYYANLTLYVPAVSYLYAPLSPIYNDDWLCGKKVSGPRLHPELISFIEIPNLPTKTETAGKTLILTQLGELTPDLLTLGRETNVPIYVTLPNSTQLARLT